MRASERREIEIAVDPDTVWRAVSRADLLDCWFPGVETCVLVDNVRTVGLRSGLTLDEEVIWSNPLQRRFQYRIRGGFFAEHLSTIDVIALAPDRSLVTYSSDVDPATMAIVLGGAMEEALTRLRQQLETGAGPLIDALAAPEPPLTDVQAAPAAPPAFEPLVGSDPGEL